MATQPLDLRTLNRTLLARQLLLERSRTTAHDAVAHLVGLQSQTPASPYPGLWTRLAGFDFTALGALLTERRVVRTALMRNTVHLVTAEDALLLRPWLQPMLERSFRSSAWAAGAAGADRAEVTGHGRRLLRERPRTPAQLRTELAARFPAADPASLVHALRAWLPLVQLPPRGVWGHGGGPVYGLLEEWLGVPQSRHDAAAGPDAAGPDQAAHDPAAPDPAVLVRRYLAAFGPATPADMQKWCGLSGLGPVFAAMDLRRYAAPEGGVLYDLPDAELADPQEEVSARLVGDFDNLVLSHADRTRILAAAHKSRVITVNGLVRGTVLVDGFVGGTWQFERGKGTAAIAVTPFAPLRAADRSALEAEALRLLAASDPHAAHQVRFGAG